MTDLDGTFAEVGAGFSLAHAATASLLAVVTVLTILETESEYLSPANVVDFMLASL